MVENDQSDGETQMEMLMMLVVWGNREDHKLTTIKTLNFTDVGTDMWWLYLHDPDAEYGERVVAIIPSAGVIAHHGQAPK